MATDLRKLIEALAAASVDFVVVGGVAVVAHGHVRATLDLDVCYCLPPKTSNGSPAHSRRFIRPCAAPLQTCPSY